MEKVRVKIAKKSERKKVSYGVGVLYQSIAQEVSELCKDIELKLTNMPELDLEIL